MKKLIDVYVYRIKAEEPEFLLLKRSSGKIYANQWRMVGGKVAAEESYHEAAYRELLEETELQPELFWVIPSVNSFYEAETDQVHHIPAFAVQVDQEAIPTLDEEHIDHQWVKQQNVKEYITWPEQNRLIEIVHRIVTNHQILPEWLLDIDSY